MPKSRDNEFVEKIKHPQRPEEFQASASHPHAIERGLDKRMAALKALETPPSENFADDARNRGEIERG